jgi:cytochrome c
MHERALRLIAPSLATLLCLALAGCTTDSGTASRTASAPDYGLGTRPTASEVAAWDSDIGPNGINLPAGLGSVARGREVYTARCIACHGARGEGGMGDRLVGGRGTLASANPIRTIGSYWQYATTLFDYVRRAMPLNAPQSLSNDDVYAVCAYLLYLNGLVSEDAVIDARTLIDLKMPNRNGFIGDTRPDVSDAPCMRDCRK